MVHHASVRLDGADIWDSGDKPVTDDLVTVAERPVKPGPHALTLRIDIRPGKKSKDSDKLGYVSEHTFAIIVPDGKRTRVAIKGDEDGERARVRAGDRGRARDAEMIPAMLCLLLASSPTRPRRRSPGPSTAAPQSRRSASTWTDLEQSGVLAAPAGGAVAGRS